MSNQTVSKTAKIGATRVVKAIAMALLVLVGVSQMPHNTAAAGAPLGGTGYAPLTPARILDTRAGATTVDDLFAGAGVLGQDKSLDLLVTGRGGVPPSGVGAVVLNITAVDQTSRTFVTVYPKGSPRPLASNMNPSPGITQPNLVIAKVGTDGQVTIYNHTGSLHLIADVQGWYPSTQGVAYNSVVPARLLDTRPGFGTIDGRTAGMGPLVADQSLDLVVVGRGGVPDSNVGAVVVNLTATDQTRHTYVTAYPTGSARPTASNINPNPGLIAANVVIVKVGAGGMISLYNHTGSVNVIVDVQGWFPVGPTFTPVDPARLIDTRPASPTIDGQFQGAGELGPDATTNITVTGRAGVPATGVGAVVVNVTAVNQSRETFLTVFATGTSRPATSNLNPVPDVTAPNLVLARVGADGQISVYNHAGTVDIVADVYGWFASDTVAGNDIATVGEDAAATAIDVLSNDIDHNGGDVTIASISQPANGTVTATGGTATRRTGVSYQPHANYCNAVTGTAPDTFTYTLNGGVVGTVSVTVTCVDDAPIAVADSVTVAHDSAPSAVLVLANDTDVDGGPESIQSVTQPGNGVVAIVAGGAALTYAPASTFCGADSFTYVLNGGSSAVVTVNVTCGGGAPGNAQPTVVLSAGNALLTEGQSAQVIDSTISVTDANDVNLESASVSLTASFEAAHDALVFTNQSGIAGSYNASTGVLTLSGTSLVSNYQAALRTVKFFTNSEDPLPSKSIVFVVDDGDISSNAVMKTVAVTAVNDPPVNTVPGAQSTNEDTDLTFSSTTGNSISVADADAGAAQITTTMTVLHGTITPASGSGAVVSGSGTASAAIVGSQSQVNAALNGLVYRGTPNYNATRGAETVSVHTDDHGNSGGSAAVDTDTIAVNVNAISDQPVATTQPFDVVTNMQRKITVALSGPQGPTDPDTGDGGYTTAFNLTTITAPVSGCGGCVVSNVDLAAGTFDFEPPVGQTGTYAISYSITDSGNPGPPASATGVLAITVAGPTIWFVDPSASTNGTGALSSPFQQISGAAGANNDANDVDAANDRIFVYSGVTAAGGLTLNDGEWIVGQAAGPGSTFDALFGLGSVPTGTIARPALGAGPSTSNGTVVLANNSKVQGMTLSTAGSAALVGSVVTGVDVSQTALVTTTGTALSLVFVDGSVALSDLDKNGAGSGVTLIGVNANVTIAAGATIASTTDTAIDIDGGVGGFAYAGSIANTSGRAVEVTNRTGASPGLVQFNGLVTSTGATTGVNLDSNTTGAVKFSGGLVLATANATAFNASNGGTVTVTDPNAVGTVPDNSITSSAGVALTITDTNIGAAGLNFRTISAGTGVGSAGNGIILDTTGSAGGLTVTGFDGADAGTRIDAGSGGTIQHKTGADATTNGIGIYLDNTQQVSLAGMQSNDFDNYAIHGRNVSGFHLSDTVIGGVIGTSAASSDSAVGFGLPNPSGVNGLVGLGNSITDVDISGAVEHNLEVYGQTGTFGLVVLRANIHDNSTSSGADGIHVEVENSASSVIVVDDSDFDDNKTQAISAQASDSSALDITINNSTVTRTNQGNLGFVLRNAAAAHLTAHVVGNVISGIGGRAIFVGQTTTATSASLLTAVIRDNDVTHSTTATDHAIVAYMSGVGSVGNILIDHNTVAENSAFGGPRAILVDSPDLGMSPSFTATVTNNIVSVGDNGVGALPIAILGRQSAAACFDIRSNVATFPNGVPTNINGVRAGQSNTAVVTLEQGVSGGAATTVLAANNPSSTTEIVGTISVGSNSTCQTAPV